MEKMKRMALLVLLAVITACNMKLLRIWTVPLDTPSANGVNAVWISRTDQRVNLLWQDTQGLARIEQFDQDGSAWGSLTVDSTNWTGSHAINPTDDSVFLLERQDNQATPYSLLHQQLQGTVTRVNIAHPDLLDAQVLNIKLLPELTSEGHLILDATLRPQPQLPAKRQISLLSPTGSLLGQFSAPHIANSHLLATDSGYVWVEFCQASTHCAIRIVTLDSHLQVVNDTQTTQEDFSYLSYVSLVFNRLVVSSDSHLYVIDLAGQIERQLDSLQGYVRYHNSFRQTATGAYVVLEIPGGDNGYNLCRLTQDWQTQWCQTVTETRPALLGYSGVVREGSIHAVSDGKENLYLSFVVNKIYGGVRGKLDALPAEEALANLGLDVQLTGTDETHVYYLKYAPDGRRVGTAKEDALTIEGKLKIDESWMLNVAQENITPGICWRSHLAAVPTGGLLTVSQFCTLSNDPPTQWHLSHWQ